MDSVHDPIVRRKASFYTCSRDTSLGSTETGGTSVCSEVLLPPSAFSEVSTSFPDALQPCSTFTKEQADRSPLADRGPQDSPQPDRIKKMFSSGAVSRASRADSDWLFADPSQTLLFFDWDDTLFPTTELFDRWGLPSNQSRWDSMELTSAQEMQLEKWSTACFQYLCTACSLAERCVIVTNSKRPWVTDCINRFAPNLQRLFDKEDGPHIVYAREAHTHATRKISSTPPVRWQSPRVASEEEHEEQLRAWKYAAMRHEAKTFYSRHKGQTWKNLISIGDMRYEHDAIQDLSFRRVGPRRERLRTKAFITGLQPSISALTFQMTHGVPVLPAIVRHNGDIDLDFDSASNRFEALAEALGIPEIIDKLPESLLELGSRPASDEFPDLCEESLSEDHIFFEELIRDELE